MLVAQHRTQPAQGGNAPLSSDLIPKGRYPSDIGIHMAQEDTEQDIDTTSTSEDTSKDDKNPQKKTDDTKDSDFDYDKEHERITTRGAEQKPQQRQGSKYTPAEKATNSFKATLKELEKHGIDPRSIMGGDDNEQDDDTPAGKGGKAITQQDVERIIQESAAKQRDELMEPIIDSKISPITRSAGEAKLVKHYTKVFMQQGSDMDEAVEIGWFVANRHRFKETFAEFTRGKAAEKGRGDGAGSGQRKTLPRQAPTGREAEFAKNRGLVLDEETNTYISPARKTFLDKQRNPNRANK